MSSDNTSTNKLQRPILTWFAYFLFKLWSSSWRIKVIIHPETQKLIDKNLPLSLAHWHGDEIPLLSQVSRFKLATMTSTSKDGELIDFTIKKMGGSTARGSSTRGGIGALKGLIRLARSGYSCSLAVDGPKGPIYKVKPGILEIASLTRSALVPVAASTSFGLVLKNSWNKALLPWPFAKIVLYFDKPLPPHTSRDKAELQAKGLELEVEINNARKAAESYFPKPLPRA